MELLIVLVVSYVFAGLSGAMAALSDRFIDRPAWARNPTTRMFLLVVVTWPYVDFIQASGISPGKRSTGIISVFSSLMKVTCLALCYGGLMIVVGLVFDSLWIKAIGGLVGLLFLGPFLLAPMALVLAPAVLLFSAAVKTILREE